MAIGWTLLFLESRTNGRCVSDRVLAVRRNLSRWVPSSASCIQSRSCPRPVPCERRAFPAGARAPSRPLSGARQCRPAAPTRPPFNSMYDTPYQLSLVWRATVPLSDCWVQHYSGRGERVALSVACGVRVAWWRVWLLLWRVAASLLAVRSASAPAELPGTLLRQGRQGRTPGVLAWLCHGSKMFVSTP